MWFCRFALCISSAYRRVRREFAPAGESLSFVASNESNQSKDALHFAVPLRLLPSATCRLRSTSDHGTTVRGTPPLVSLRIVSMTLRAATRPGAEAKRGVLGKLRSNDRIALGPRGWRRGAQGFGAARVSALRQLTSRRLSERSGRRPRSEFGAGPKDRAPQSSRPQADRYRRVPLSLVTFFRGSERKLLPCRGHIPTSASRSEQKLHANAGAAPANAQTGSTSAGPTTRTSKKLP
jgi:hypothetical protein